MDGLTLLRPDEPAAGIDEAERARRVAAVEYARSSLRLEGFTLDAATETLNQRYIDGEITSAEHTAMVRDTAGL